MLPPTPLWVQNDRVADRSGVGLRATIRNKGESDTGVFEVSSPMPNKNLLRNAATRTPPSLALAG